MQHSPEGNFTGNDHDTYYEHVFVNHWGRVTHICVSKLTIIGSDNGLSPGRRQAIIWTNAGILLIGPLRTNFNETSIEIHTFSFKKIYLQLSSAKWRPFCPGLNVLRYQLHLPSLRQWVNSLAPGRFESNFWWEISKFILVFGGWGVSCESAIRWISVDLLLVSQYWFR